MKLWKIAAGLWLFSKLWEHETAKAEEEYERNHPGSDYYEDDEEDDEDEDEDDEDDEC